MPIPSRATLKSYFEDGDEPTQAQRYALIDAMYDMAQEATDTAQQAVADLAAAVAAMPPDFFPVLAMAKFTRDSTANGETFTPTEQINVDGDLTQPTNDGDVHMDFVTPTPDTNWNIEVYARQAGATAALTLTYTKFTTGIIMQFPFGGAGLRDVFIIIRQNWQV